MSHETLTAYGTLALALDPYATKSLAVQTAKLFEVNIVFVIEIT